MTARTRKAPAARAAAASPVATRRITFGGANSLDNFIARPDHAVDWLMWSDEAGEIMKDYWATIDTVIMGRKTYEVAARSAQGGGGYPGLKTCICSRTMTSAPKGATLVPDACEFVRRIKREPGKGICIMGGGELARPLLEAGLIDEIGFNIHPVLLGSGIPLFHSMKNQIDLELLECRPFKNGCVYVRYAVKGLKA
jgi:dihydrofolate reductase